MNPHESDNDSEDQEITPPHRAMYIIPNSLTMAGVFCGVYAILLTISSNGLDAIHQAGMAIFFAGFFDMFDGRVARLTHTQSEFGMELDSLADGISFGLAPAVLIYKWSLWQMGLWGMVIAFCFAGCGLIRLARFNVLTKNAEGPSNFFVGLPIPLGAVSLVAFILAHDRLLPGTPIQQHLVVSCVVLVLAILMVSAVPYWSFKKVHFDTKFSVLLFLSLVMIIGLSFLVPPSVLVALVLLVYLLAGLLRAVIVRYI